MSPGLVQMVKNSLYSVRQETAHNISDWNDLRKNQGLGAALREDWERSTLKQISMYPLVVARKARRRFFGLSSEELSYMVRFHLTRGTLPYEIPEIPKVELPPDSPIDKYGNLKIGKAVYPTAKPGAIRAAGERYSKRPGRLDERVMSNREVDEFYAKGDRKVPPGVQLPRRPKK